MKAEDRPDKCCDPLLLSSCLKAASCFCPPRGRCWQSGRGESYGFGAGGHAAGKDRRAAATDFTVPWDPALKGDMQGCTLTRSTLPPWCLLHPTDRLFLTKNKATKRSVKSPKSVCVFPECLREKLPTVKGVTAPLFRKAVDNCPPTWTGPGNAGFDKWGWMFQSQLESCSWKQREDWNFCNNRNSRDSFPVNSSCPLFQCI